MSRFDFVVSSEIEQTIRVKQLSSMFDVPISEKLSLEFKGELPIETFDWNVGLIVGPSGCGKTLMLDRIFGQRDPQRWKAKSIIDDFPKSLSIEEIAKVCQSVGFNTIPAWMRPYSVLSNGEKFRAEMARHLLAKQSPIVIDEFTSVVDRQIAKIGSHSVQKYVRSKNLKFIAASCHYDVIDWLQPDWVYEPGTSSFTRRSLRRRPEIAVEIGRVPHTSWSIFAPFHYLTKKLNKSARCFSLFINDQPASFAAILHRPHPKTDDIKGISRLVTLPDWQGLGLAMILAEKLGQAYKALGFRLHMYPSHPSLVRSFVKDRGNWKMIKAPGVFSPRQGRTSNIGGHFGGRACAVFEFRGGKMDAEKARLLIA